MLYETHYKEGKKVTFKKLDLNIAGILFLPDNFDKKNRYPAIVVTHPGGRVKEQCSSLYAFQYIDAISPKPLLFIVESKADTLYFTEDAYKKANAPKEIFTIENATHVDLYDKPEFVNKVVHKLTEFFDKGVKKCLKIYY